MVRLPRIRAWLFLVRSLDSTVVRHKRRKPRDDLFLDRRDKKRQSRRRGVVGLAVYAPCGRFDRAASLPKGTPLLGALLLQCCTGPSPVPCQLLQLLPACRPRKCPCSHTNHLRLVPRVFPLGERGWVLIGS